jgi:hypothetical protein
MTHMRIPAPGTIRRRIMEMLPATNRMIGNALAMHSGEVARTMSSMRDQGLVINDAPGGRGRLAIYALTIRAQAALDG